MDKFTVALVSAFLGSVGGAVLLACLIEGGPMEQRWEETKIILEQCEKSLPRDQKCVLMAVEESKLEIIEKGD